MLVTDARASVPGGIQRRRSDHCGRPENGLDRGVRVIGVEGRVRTANELELRRGMSSIRKSAVTRNEADWS